MRLAAARPGNSDKLCDYISQAPKNEAAIHNLGQIMINSVIYSLLSTDP